MQSVMEFLKGKTFYLATVKDGKPTIRPFGAVMEFESKLYFVTSNTKEVYKQIIANPNISICACGENREWIRISGIAKQDDRVVAKQKMLDGNPVLLERKRYSSSSDKTMAVFYLEDMEVEWH